MKVLVIGAGIIGAVIAHSLAPHARVTVIEAAAPAAAASGKSFGWINASFYQNPDHHRLRVQAIAAHRRLDANLRTGIQWTGTLWWEETGLAFEATHENLLDLGYPVRLIDPDEFQRLEPNIATPPDRALQFPTEGAVDAAALTERLLTAAMGQGAQVWLGTPVLRLIHSGGRVTGVHTAEGALDADHTILATGTATPGLLGDVDYFLPMRPRPGILLRSEPLPPLINHILAGPGGEIRQDSAGHLLTPASPSHQSDDAETLPPLADLADATRTRIRALLPDTDLRWSRITLGLRPVPEHGLPVVGEVRPGLTVAVMHSGITLAALVGELVAAEVLGQGESPLLAPYRPVLFI
jgi:glycine/D-amino acid oxidase-like deaminating enzyme